MDMKQGNPVFHVSAVLKTYSSCIRITARGMVRIMTPGNLSAMALQQLSGLAIKFSQAVRSKIISSVFASPPSFRYDSVAPEASLSALFSSAASSWRNAARSSLTS